MTVLAVVWAATVILIYRYSYDGDSPIVYVILLLPSIWAFKFRKRLEEKNDSEPKKIETSLLTPNMMLDDISNPISVHTEKNHNRLELITSRKKIVKQIVCLANSRKLNGRCVAGKELIDNVPQSWIRPISARVDGEVSESERKLRGGGEPNVFDVVNIALLEHKPKGHQRENWLLDTQECWTRSGFVSYADLDNYLDPDKPLWGNDFKSDRVLSTIASTYEDSLRFIHIKKLTLSVEDGYEQSKRKLRGIFYHSGLEYNLSVTDPYYEGIYLQKTKGVYKINDCYLTISLGEPYNGYCYKLIATIIENNRR